MPGSMYVVSTPRDALNRRVLGLYYGTMALAQAEMLTSPYRTSWSCEIS